MKKTPKVLNAHAKKRAEERYGLNLNKHARREIVQMIQSNKAEFVAKESNNRSLWRVSYENQSLNVVYDRLRSTMCTVLPRDAAEFLPTATVEVDVRTEAKQNSRKQITDELKALWGEN